MAEAVFSTSNSVQHVKFMRSDEEITSPEPSSPQFMDYLAADGRELRRWSVESQKAYKAMVAADEQDDKGEFKLSPEDREAAFERAHELAREIAQTHHDRMVEIVSEVLSGVPSVEEIHGWDHRTQARFIGYVKEVYRPED